MTNLFPDGDYSFAVHGGEYHDDRGKVHWPALLRLVMDEREAWRVVQTLIAQLSDLDKRDVFDVALVGAIERVDENGNRVMIDGSLLEDDRE